MATRFLTSLVIGLALAASLRQASCAESRHEPAKAGAKLAEADPGKPHGEGGDEGPQPLEFKTDLAIWTAVVFLVLLALLSKFAWGPLTEGLDRREQAIFGQIAQAEEANRQAKEVLGRYEQQLANAKEEVRGILAEARRDAEQHGREMLDKAKQEAEAEHQRALREIDHATAAALKELAERSATLAVDLAGKIIGATLNAQDHQQLIEQAVSNFAKQEPSTN